MEKSIIITLAAFTLLLLGQAVHAGTAFHCTVKSTAGFEKKVASKKWEPTLFTFAREYYVTSTGLTVPKSKYDAYWIVQSRANSNPSSFCTDKMTRLGSLVCTSGLMYFNMNKKTKRFIATDMMSYFQDGTMDRFVDGRFPITMAIGTCKEIDTASLPKNIKVYRSK